jgi:hypothetical protein
MEDGGCRMDEGVRTGAGASVRLFADIWRVLCSVQETAKSLGKLTGLTRPDRGHPL